MHRCFKRFTSLILLLTLLAGVPWEHVWASDMPPEDVNLSAEIQEGSETVNDPLMENSSAGAAGDQILDPNAASIEGGLSDPVKPYLYHRAEQKKSPIQMSGLTYDDAVVFTMGRANFNDSSFGEVDYNLKENYSSLSFYAGYYSGDQRNATLTVAADGKKVIDAQAISWKNIAKPYRVDLNGVKHLTIRFTSDGSYNTNYAIGKLIMTPIASKKEDKVLSSNMLYNCGPYDHTNASTVAGRFEMGGNTYEDGIHMDMRYTGDSTGYTSMAFFNFDGHYRSLSFDIGRFGTDEARNASLTIQADGKTLVDSETIFWNDIPRNFEVDLTGVSQLIIRTSCGGSYPVSYRLGNIRLVSDGNVQGIVFKKKSVSVSPGTPTVQLEPVVIPSDARNQGYTLETDSSITAMVEQNGLVTGRHGGTATITAVTEEGGHKATCTVKSTLPAARFVPSVDGWGFTNQNINILQGSSVSDYYADIYKRVCGISDIYAKNKLYDLPETPNAPIFFFYHLCGLSTCAGLCHGYAITSALTYTKDLPFSTWDQWEEPIPKIPADIKVLKDYVGHSYSLDMYLKQAIYACHISQISTSSLVNEMTHSNDYGPLLDAVKNFQETGKDPVTIKISLKFGRNGGAHSLLPYEVMEKGNKIYIYVYDSNMHVDRDNDPDNNRIVLTKDNKGNITDWSYTDCGSNFSSKNNNLSYIDSLDEIADRIKKSAVLDIPNKIVFLASQTFSVKRGEATLMTYSNGDLSNDISQTDIIPFTDMGDTIYPDRPEGIALCPLTDDTFTFENNSSPDTTVTTLVADGDSAFVIESDGASHITSSAGTEGEIVQVTPSKSGTVSIRYNHGDDNSIQVSGKTDGSVGATVVSGNDDISLVGYNNIQVTVTNDGKETVKKDVPVSPGSEYVVSPSGQITGEFPDEPTTPTPPADDKKDEKPKKTAVKKIVLSGISNKIAAGKKIRLSASVEPRNATVKTIDWRSSDPKIATVDQKGNVSVKRNAKGRSVKITATAKDGSRVKAIYTIQVMKGTVRSIKITGPKTIKAGAKAKLKAKVSASTGANKKLVWSSSNKKYATVNASGKITTKRAGKKKTVKITAKATDGSGKKATFTVRLK